MYGRPSASPIKEISFIIFDERGTTMDYASVQHQGINRRVLIPRPGQASQGNGHITRIRQLPATNRHQMGFSAADTEFPMLSADGNFQFTRPPRNGYFQGHLQASFTTRSHISSKDNFSVIPVPDSLIGNTPPFLPSGRPPGISPNRNSHGLTRRPLRFPYIHQSPCPARADRGQDQSHKNRKTACQEQ